MSDVVQAAEKAVAKETGKVKAFFAAFGVGIRRIGKELWSLVADREWNFDPYKASGFGAFGLAGWIAIKVVDLALKVPTPDAAVLGILAGLVTAFITVGTFLFSQSRKSDDTLGGRAA
jgi:hypothetical protein